jgi:hypothetical protein
MQIMADMASALGLNPVLSGLLVARPVEVDVIFQSDWLQVLKPV